MKKIFTFLTFICVGTLSSQSLELWSLNPTQSNTVLVVANGDEVAYTTSASTSSTTSTRTVPFKFKNISATTNTYSVVRTDVQLNPGASAYFCFGDIGSCFPATTYEPGPTDYSVLAPGGETSPGINLMTDLDEAMTVGYSEVRYKLFNVATGKNGADTLSFTIKYNQLLSVNENTSIIANVSDVYPNPSSSNASLSLILSQESSVKVQVYNSLGALVYSANDQKYPQGKNKISVDCSNLNSGIYLVSLNAGGSKITKRLIINK